MKKTSKNFKATQTDGTNQQASVVEGFERESLSDHTDSIPQKFRKKEI